MPGDSSPALTQPRPSTRKGCSSVVLIRCEVRPSAERTTRTRRWSEVRRKAQAARAPRPARRCRSSAGEHEIAGLEALDAGRPARGSAGAAPGAARRWSRRRSRRRARTGSRRRRGYAEPAHAGTKVDEGELAAIEPFLRTRKYVVALVGEVRRCTPPTGRRRRVADELPAPSQISPGQGAARRPAGDAADGGPPRGRR